MTASQRLRLVVALGAVNLVLAIVAFGLVGSANVAPQSAARTAAPSVTAGPVAAGSPAPTAPASNPSNPPVQPSSEPPASPAAPQATVAPAETQPTAAAAATQPTALPAETPAPVAVVLEEPPPSAAPSAAPVEPPTLATATHDIRAVPLCPGTTTGAPGRTKQAADPDRPCQGGETASGTRPGRGQARDVSAGHRRVARAAFEAPTGQLTERVRLQARHRTGRRIATTLT